MSFIPEYTSNYRAYGDTFCKTIEGRLKDLEERNDCRTELNNTHIICNQEETRKIVVNFPEELRNRFETLRARISVAHWIRYCAADYCDEYLANPYKFCAYIKDRLTVLEQHHDCWQELEKMKFFCDADTIRERAVQRSANFSHEFETLRGRIAILHQYASDTMGPNSRSGTSDRYLVLNSRNSAKTISLKNTPFATLKQMQRSHFPEIGSGGNQPKIFTEPMDDISSYLKYFDTDVKMTPIPDPTLTLRSGQHHLQKPSTPAPALVQKNPQAQHNERLRALITDMKYVKIDYQDIIEARNGNHELAIEHGHHDQARRLYDSSSEIGEAFNDLTHFFRTKTFTFDNIQLNGWTSVINFMRKTEKGKIQIQIDFETAEKLIRGWIVEINTFMTPCHKCLQDFQERLFPG